MSYEPFKNPRDTMDYFTKLNAAKTVIETAKTAQEAKKQTKLMEEQNRLLREQNELKRKEQKQNEQGTNSDTKPVTTSRTSGSYSSSYTTPKNYTKVSPGVWTVKGFVY